MIRRPIPMLAALTVGLVGCNDDTPVFFPTDTGGTTDTGTGGTDTGTDAGSEDTGSEDTGSEDTGSEDTGSEDTGSEDTGSEDTGSEDTGSEDTGSGTITPEIQAILDAYCAAASECDTDPEFTAEVCSGYVNGYASQLADAYGAECFDAYMAMFECIVEVNDCVDGSLTYVGCETEYAGAQEICGFE